ncbi:uncharacterized protein LOC114763002 [Neltuma alba]|uniref:uncharacterized protein LOC114751694 n=1 Tax=Neltuma alba TaxID=207710 RepID=UPI0010A426F8|nr:uncharacterized protein LOC114751694 [Prosopis alba]XP_028808431.1 uncharacterized protein LOC114763002 [Prosopis alba]
MTNSSRNKFFLCFRPVVMLDSAVESDGSPPTASHNHEIHNPHNSLPPKRKLSRVIKAMVVETILNRRARRKNRSRRDSSESDRSYSTTYTEETSSTGDDSSIWSQTSVDITSIQEINSESRFSLSSSDSKFLSKSKSCPSEAKARKRSRRDQRNKLDCSGIYMFLLSLILTVFWGKILGILLTSICLYSYSVLKKRSLRQKTVRKDGKNRNQKGRLQ